jgi:hypothetical protein
MIDSADEVTADARACESTKLCERLVIYIYIAWIKRRAKRHNIGPSTARGSKYTKAGLNARTPSSESDPRKQEKPGRQSVEDRDGEPNKLSDFLPVPEAFLGS